MGAEGRDESRGDGGAADAERLRPSQVPPQVPPQGGPAGAPRGAFPARDGVPPRADVPAPTGVPAQAGVPARRERWDDGVPPPPVELPPSDVDLIGRMRAGDDTAYEELYRRHADAVRRYARTCCRDAHTADDLTAEVFARMLQAVRGGSGPEHAVRAYLLTTVRRVAAHWTRTARREQLVDDFAVFAAQAAHGSGGSEDTASPGSFGAGSDLGADVRAMHEAEQSLAMRAFRSLPERWQAVLWHTEVEDESPSEVATLFGLDANGTRVLASRAREGLRQAYLQAHVSAALTGDAECARYADRLGTYARGRLRTRAERGLRKHLEECARCRLAAVQIEEVADGIPAVVPVAVLGWFGATGYAKALGLLAGGAGAAGAAGAATGGGAAAGSPAAGSAAGGGASGGAAASEGLGAPVKAGIAAGVVATAAAAVALALAGHGSPAGKPETAPPPPSAPVVEPQPPTLTPPEKPLAPRPPVRPAAAHPAPKPAPSRSPSPTPTPTPPPKQPSPTPPPPPPPTPTPPPSPSPTPTPTPPPPPAPAVYAWNELDYDVVGDGTAPEMRLAGSSWVWQRHGLSVDGERYARGVTVHGASSVTVDLNRPCSAYDARVGVDDLTAGPGRVSFAVYADGVRLWSSDVLAGGDPAVPVHVSLAGRSSVRLTVVPHDAFDSAAVADWADSVFTCAPTGR